VIVRDEQFSVFFADLFGEISKKAGMIFQLKNSKFRK
jgi:thiamine pyrophosphate-dependent acetolactate synthase large subunit-like protein